jgi:CRP/FNR family transcriptional regulator, cyclic AMP receptor protein
MADMNSLAEFPFFASFPKSALNSLARLGRVLDLRRDKAVYYQGEKSNGCYFLISGSIRRTKYRSNETSINLELRKPGQWLGLTETVLDSMYLNDAVTMEKSRLLFLTPNNFGQALADPLFSHRILGFLAKEHFLLHTQIELNQPLSRIIKNLLAAVEGKVADKQIVYTTQELLAEITGVSRETVNKHLNRLQNQGYIQLGRGEIKVLDSDGLSELV